MSRDSFSQRRRLLFTREFDTGSLSSPSKFRWSIGIIVMLVVVGCIILAMTFPAPRDFPAGERIRIEQGSTVTDISNTLQDANMIRSRNMFELTSSLLGKASKLQAGDYVFDKPLGLVRIIKRIAHGEHGDVLLRLTILEGSTLNDIALSADRILEDFDTDLFIDYAIDFNGYLFPETYFILPGTSEQQLVEIMHDQFSTVLNKVGSDKLNTLQADELRDIVIMASIIEREAAGIQDAYIISGILWKRIEIGMPLQVDASFAYLFDKESSELTRADLEFDSPYNTYKYAGLPPGPLGNPGEIALDAALHPADSPYLFYLHAPDGSVHYGVDHNEHVNNKNKYLK